MVGTHDDQVAPRDALADVIRKTGFGVAEPSSDASVETGNATTNAVANHQRRVMLTGVALTVPLFILSMGRDFGIWGPWANATWVNYLMFALATPVQFYVGSAFYAGAWRSLRSRFANMNVLVTMSTSVAYAFSVCAMIALTMGSSVLGTHVYYETSATIITLVMVGHWIESRAQAQTGGAIASLLNLQSKSARVIRGDVEVEIAAKEVVRGDRVRVLPGEQIPVDGTVMMGQSAETLL